MRRSSRPALDQSIHARSSSLEEQRGTPTTRSDERVRCVPRVSPDRKRSHPRPLGRLLHAPKLIATRRSRMCSWRRSSRPSCSTSSPWLRPSSEWSSGRSPIAGSDALRRSRQLPPGRRRWPSASAARTGRSGRRLLSPLQDGRAGCAAVRPRLQHVGLWRGTRMTERFAQGEPGAWGERVVMVPCVG